MQAASIKLVNSKLYQSLTSNGRNKEMKAKHHQLVVLFKGDFSTLIDVHIQEITPKSPGGRSVFDLIAHTLPIG